MKAFAYLRVSGKGQVEGDGFPRQLAAIRKYAGQNGIDVVQVYEERGKSGTIDGMDRPTWAEMIGVIMGNGVKTVLIERLDRLARDLMVQEHIIADLKQRGVELISVAEPDLCQDDPTRKLMRQILGAIAEYDRTMIVLKLRGSRQRAKALVGKCEGRKAYGEKPEEVAVLNEMRALRALGMSFDGIAEALNRGGRSPRSGGQWYGSTVNKILRRVQG